MVCKPSSVYQLVEGQYQVQKFTESDRILSNTFPELELTVEQVVDESPTLVKKVLSCDRTYLLAPAIAPTFA
jgi:hypothetical protein